MTLFLHCYDVHSPYAPPPPFDRMFEEAPYAGDFAPTSKARRQRHPWVERLVLVALGLVLGAGLLEGGLRIAALFFGPRVVGPASRDRLAILCVGDSHTYGVHFPPDQVYPGQLQQLLDVRAPGRYQVVNLGLPGMNSSEIRVRLPGWLDRYRPYAVVACAGINNFWNRSETESASPGWLRGLRLYRFYTLAAMHLRTVPPLPAVTDRPEFVRTLRDEGETGEEYRDARSGELLIAHRGNIRHMRQHALPDVDARALLRRDLEAMRQMTAERGVKLVLLTYSAFPLPGRPEPRVGTANEHMNEEMRAFSHQHALPLVDVHDRFAALLPPGVPRIQLFDAEGDDHPNPRGYTEIARLVADAFEPARPDESSGNELLTVPGR